MAMIPIKLTLDTMVSLGHQDVTVITGNFAVTIGLTSVQNTEDRVAVKKQAGEANPRVC